VATLSVGSTPLARPTPRLIRLVRANERLFYGILGFVVVGLLWEAAGDLGPACLHYRSRYGWPQRSL